MRWWIADPDRWEREIHDMGAWFPDWQYDLGVHYHLTGEPFLIIVWEGELQPLPDSEQEAVKILAHLKKDSEVIVGRGGTLLHPPACTDPDDDMPAQVRGRSDYGTRFALRTEQFAPPAHPKVYSDRPHLGPELYETQGHVNRDGSLCPYTATDEDWNGRRDTLALYLRRGVSILLAKHLYWTWTGNWPGQRGPHGEIEADAEARQRPPNVQCWCGSGKPYRDCHKKKGQPRIFSFRRASS